MGRLGVLFVKTLCTVPKIARCAPGRYDDAFMPFSGFSGARGLSSGGWSDFRSDEHDLLEKGFPLFRIMLLTGKAEQCADPFRGCGMAAKQTRWSVFGRRN